MKSSELRSINKEYSFWYTDDDFWQVKKLDENEKQIMFYGQHYHQIKHDSLYNIILLNIIC
jgi:hypothetical protein